MSEIDLAGTMDALAAKIRASSVGSHDRVYAWPTKGIAAPCWVVGYPSELTFDMTFQRGSDTATFPIWYIAGTLDQESSRTALSGVIAGAVGVKNAIDGDLVATGGEARVTNCTIEPVNVGSGELLAARFDTEVMT